MNVWMTDFFLPFKEWYSGLGIFIAPSIRPRPPVLPYTPRELLGRLHADELTAKRVEDLPFVRVSEALSFHNYLDPDLLGFQRGAPYVHFESLCERTKEVAEDNPLLALRGDMPSMREAVLSGELRCKAIDQREPLDSLVNWPDFMVFLEKRAMVRRPPADWLARKRFVLLPFAHTSPLLELLSRLSFRWTRMEDGGTWDLRVKATEPRNQEIQKEAKESGCPGISSVIALAMAKILRPPLASSSGAKGSEGLAELLARGGKFPEVILVCAPPKKGPKGRA